MSNQNKTYTSLNDVKALVNKTSTNDSTRLKTIFNNVVQLIRLKHL